VLVRYEHRKGALHYSLTITIIWGPYRVSAEVEDHGKIFTMVANQ